MSLDNYEPVSERIKRFYADHPNGAIHSELVFDDGVRVVVKAVVWRDITDPAPAGIDYAEEILADRGVNATSRIENASTSAQGRCLSAIGYLGSDWTKKPSREEMAKVQRATTSNAAPSDSGFKVYSGERQNGGSALRPGTLPGTVSDKQVGYIKGACKREGCLPPSAVEGWSKQEASDWIDAHKNGTPAKACPQPDVSEEEPF